MISAMSDWFRTYGFAEVYDGLLVGAYPLDADDVRMLSAMSVQRILNLVPVDRSGQAATGCGGANR